MPACDSQATAEAIAKIVDGQDLTAAEAEAVMEEIMSGRATEAQIAGLLVALRMKGEKPAEISGFARAMRRHALIVPVRRQDTIDTCGTGGDVLDTFNVSTAAAIVAAAAGAAVAKHGNRSVTSRCGSADLLEYLGVRLDLTPEQVGQCIDTIGIGFMFAPALHPAMRHAIGPRRQLRIRTVFNLLGPLTNPAGARRQVLGVYSARWVRPVAEALRELGSEHALVVHGLDGLDEISTLGPTLIAELKGGRIVEDQVAPEDLGVARACPEDICGADVAESAEMLHAVLRGEAGPRLDITVVNAGAALYVAGLASDIRSGAVLAREIIAGGAAERKLRELIEYTQRLAERPAGETAGRKD
ncbi:MAG: anthranilate phosphoribosyltransferase [Armatimonadetes bacterium]|nr:anthranilate phosphoribosyltransferase [Armatimonadota bacterium]